MPDPKPKKLMKGDLKNFQVLQRAFMNEQVALVSAIRKVDNAQVALVCAIQVNNDGTYTPVPFAVMVEGNSFELFYDPVAE